jgi:hypothetical protein
MNIRPPLLALSLLASSLVQAEPLYVQAPVGPNVGYAWTSHYRAGDGGWRAHDDFVLDQGASVQRVTWRGIYLTVNDANQTIDGTPNTDTWTLRFSSDAGGAPGSTLYTATMAAAQVQRVESADVGYFGSLPVKVYDFSMDLASDFDVQAGTHYWLSLQSSVSASGWLPLFAWTMGEGTADAGSYQQLLAGDGSLGGGAERAGNRAFALHGEVHELPEPASLGLALAALASLGLARRKPR